MKRGRGEKMDSRSSRQERAKDRRNLWSDVRCSRSMAFRKERRHLVILSVFAGLVLVGCGLLGGTAILRYSPPASPASGSFSASAVGQRATGWGGDATEEKRTQQLSGLEAVGSSEETAGLKVRVFNSYTKDKPIELYPWEHMAEPYKPSTMELVGWPQPGENLDYRWDVDGHLQGYGRALGVHFTTVGRKNCSVTAFDPTLTGRDPTLRGGTTGTEESARVAGPLEFTVEVKYVRREVRSLTDQDREMFFNAVTVLQRVPSAVGQAVYGSNYYSKDYLTRLHLYYGGTKDCDHWHQGAGFVTSHMALTLMFEQSLQAVNPAVTVPYWDFTLESTFFGASDFRTSGFFADDWFGNASPNNGLHTPSRGRFAYVPTMADAREFSKLHNSYGLLRAPWNNDPTPFMTRHEMIYGFFNNLKPSGCFEYSQAIRKDTWMSLSKVLNSAAHGHIHETIGGSWNHYFADEVEDLQAKKYENVMTFAHEIQASREGTAALIYHALSKELWRTDFLDCPETCSMETAWRDCQCQCDAGVMGNRSAAQVLYEAGVLDAVMYYDSKGELIDAFEDGDGFYYTLPGHSVEESTKIYERLLYMLCSPGHIGTMFQATSTNDITFWVLHPTVDRLWHLKRLGAENFNERWDPFHTCVGHNPADLQPFHDLFPTWDAEQTEANGGDASQPLKEKAYYTNSELYELLQPDRPYLPYVYDNFAWLHCSILGEDMVA